MTTLEFSRRRLLVGMTGLGLGALAAACGEGAQDAATAEGGGARGDTGELLLFSNTSPHVTAIDILTEEIVRTSDLEGLTSWAWNDDNNYFDGTNLWLGMLNESSGQAELVTLNVDTLTIETRVPLGSETMGVFLGKASSGGSLLVSKMGAGEVVSVDTASGEVRATFDNLPANGGMIADADLSTDLEGVERFAYPTGDGNTVVTIDPASGDVLTSIDTVKGAAPTRLTAAPDGTIWVQETGKHRVAVYEPTGLELIKRIEAGDQPIVGAFTTDGSYAYTGHSEGEFVQVVQAATLKPLAHIRTGGSPHMVAVRPDFTRIYAMLPTEQSVAVIYQQDWDVNSSTITSSVENTIPLGVTPVGLFLRMTSVGARLRDEEERYKGCTLSYSCDQSLGTKR